jgi:hypothetical protein
MNLFHLRIIHKELGGKEPIQIEADHGIESVIKDELVPFRSDARFVRFTPDGIFVYDFSRSPTNQSSVTTDCAASKAPQCQANFPDHFSSDRAQVVPQYKNRRTIRHPQTQVGFEQFVNAATVACVWLCAFA